MNAFEVHTPPQILIAHTNPGPVHRETIARFRRAMGRGPKKHIRARRMGALHTVHHVEFDVHEPDARIECDCIGRDTLIVGTMFVLRMIRETDDGTDITGFVQRLFTYDTDVDAALTAVVNSVHRSGGVVEIEPA